MSRLTFVRTDKNVSARLWSSQFGTKHIADLDHNTLIFLTGETDPRKMFYEALTPVGLGWIFHLWVE